KERCKTGKLPITDPRMTRFWIRIEEGAAFVEHALNLMRGGEIFVPKIPSMKITDLAKAICEKCEQEIVGIRPGEKLHELMITRDDARHTLEFKDYFVIRPAIKFWANEDPSDFGDEQGKPVAEDFEFSSDSNRLWLGTAELKGMI